MKDDDLISFTKTLDDCWSQGHLQDLPTFLAEDVVFVGPGGRPRVEGLEGALESYRQFTLYAEVKSYRTSDYVVTRRGDTAIVEYEWEMTWASGGEEHHDVGREVLVLLQREQTWKLAWRTQIPKTIPG